jgi:hypothetical protein
MPTSTESTLVPDITPATIREERLASSESEARYGGGSMIRGGIFTNDRG